MNKVIVSILFAGLGAQLIKIIIFWFRHKTLSWHDLIVTGGMPSSHSAFVTSLATAVYMEEGITTAFAISLVLMFIVIRDAFGVRRTVGEEGMVLNRIMQKMKLKNRSHFSMGHTPMQVFVGAVLGIVVSLLVYLW
jgi:acid phosphatase family membrane protein YuiD